MNDNEDVNLEKPKPLRLDGSIHELMQNILFGGTSGVIGQLSIYPLYTAKTDLHNNPDPNRGLLSRLRSINRASGFRGLYSGLVPTLSLTFPEKAIKLAMNDYFKAKLTDSNGVISVPKTMLAGAGAGVCQCVMTNPMELLRITMQERQRQGLKHLDATTLAKELGLRGLYRDVPATLMRDIPFSVIFFTLHSTFMKSFADKNGNNSSGSVLVSGFLSSTAASAFVTPMDLVKTRLMSETGMSVLLDRENDSVKRKNMRIVTEPNKSAIQRISSSFAKVYSEFGIRGLFRGVDARIMINAPLFALATMFYELQKKLKENGLINFSYMTSNDEK